MLSLYKGFSHCKFPHKILSQSEEVVKTTEKVYYLRYFFIISKLLFHIFANLPRNAMVILLHHPRSRESQDQETF